MDSTYHTYRYATQVQPQNGQLLTTHQNIRLRPAPKKIVALNRQAARQALDGQGLYLDLDGYLYLARSTDRLG